MSIVTLECIKKGSKLRIRFVKFTDADGKQIANVYDTRINCRFPKNIRKEGLFYEIPDTDLSLANSTSLYYIVKSNNIKIINQEQIIKDMHIYEVEECIICMSNTPNMLFVPCGHLCVCSNCNKQLMKYNHYCPLCPLCRRSITSAIPK